VDRITRQSKRLNRYPRTALEEAMNYHKQFKENIELRRQ
jgi:hypothetical protein